MRRIVGRTLTEKSIERLLRRHNYKVRASECGIKDWGIIDFARKCGTPITVIYKD